MIQVFLGSSSFNLVDWSYHFSSYFMWTFSMIKQRFIILWLLPIDYLKVINFLVFTFYFILKDVKWSMNDVLLEYEYLKIFYQQNACLHIGNIMHYHYILSDDNINQKFSNEEIQTSFTIWCIRLWDSYNLYNIGIYVLYMQSTCNRMAMMVVGVSVMRICVRTSFVCIYFCC